jgi:carbohydrate kinase (thermoresistant glucokinase family)
MRRDLRRHIAPGTVVVVMGVSGSGKSTVALLLAHALDWDFQEGDDLHPPENLAKMAAGTPLTDADRVPWLARIAAVIDQWREAGRSGVITCSALKRVYRSQILQGRPQAQLVYVRGTFETIHGRILRRTEHFMPVGLLESQFATLEEPDPEEHPIVLPIEQPPGALVGILIRALADRRPAG